MHARLAGLIAWALCCQAQATPLPYQAPDKHLGVASCASSLCHGSVTPNANYDVPLNEYITWSHQDAHAKAFQALTGERGRSIAAKLGLQSAQGAKACLDCHTDNVPAAQRGDKFALADGVGCEACHGGAERWIASHAAAKATVEDDVRHGMYPSAPLGDRAVLCEACHIGNADKLATHDMMAAGHPRLSFELDTYLALEPPHYTLNASYRKRKPTFSHAQAWAAGQLQASATQLDLIQGQLLHGTGVFPELSSFNCSACHNSSMQRPEWRRRAMTQLSSPGTVPFNDAYWRMSWLIARAIVPEEAMRILTQAQGLERALSAGREQVAAQAKELAALMRRVQRRVNIEGWSAARTADVLEGTVQAGLEGEFRDYLGAEQAVMAIDLLLIDSGRAARLRPQLDSLYRLVKDVDAYRSVDFIAGVKALRAAM